VTAIPAIVPALASAELPKSANSGVIRVVESTKALTRRENGNVMPTTLPAWANRSWSIRRMIARVRAKVLSGLLVPGCVIVAAVSVLAQTPSTISLRASRVLDGRGGAWENAVIEIAGSKITKIEQRSGPVTYDLGTATVLPGLIDVHVHMIAGAVSDRPAELRADQRAELWQKNFRATLMAGFTTVQSVGDAPDKPLREAIAAGFIIGPRLLTSLGQVHPGNRTTTELRAEVRKLKSEGADLIKLYGSGSGFEGGKSNVTLEQMAAVCGEARIQRLRCVVHAHPPDAIINAVKAGATEIEHGGWADGEAIKAMADANVLYDPTMSVAPTVLEHKEELMRIGRLGAKEIALMEEALPRKVSIFQKALAAGVRMPNGSDVRFPGENAREIIARVEAGQKPIDAITGATSLAAESLGLDKTIGTLAAGYEADIIAVPGKPLEDISVLRNVTFVMKGGQIYKR
jgi:imidazolonepropionase-like amidohydrolase